MQQTFLPVLLGGGLAAYAMALSFFESYGITSYALFDDSDDAPPRAKFLRAHAIPSMPLQGMRALIRVADRYPLCDRILIPCTDRAMAFAMGIREMLRSQYRMILPSAASYAALCHRPSLAAHMAKQGISFVPQLSFSSVGEFARRQASVSVPFPALLCSQGDAPTFVRRVKDREEVLDLCTSFFASGQRQPLVLTPLVGGKMPVHKVILAILDKQSHVRAAVQYRSVFRTDIPFGKKQAFLAEAADALTASLLGVCASTGFCGICRIDTVFDEHATPFVLDIHPTAGACTDLFRAAGMSAAEGLLATDTERRSCTEYPAVYWRNVHDRAVMRAGAVRDAMEAMRRKAHGFAFSPFAYEHGMQRFWTTLRYTFGRRVRRAP